MSKFRLINAFRAKVASPVFEEYIELKDKRPSDSYLPIEYEEVVSLVRHNLNILPRQQKQIVEMSKFDDLTPIASRLGISVQTVRNQLSTGLKKLRELLSETMMIIMLLFIK